MRGALPERQPWQTGPEDGDPSSAPLGDDRAQAACQVGALFAAVGRRQEGQAFVILEHLGDGAAVVGARDVHGRPLLHAVAAAGLVRTTQAVLGLEGFTEANLVDGDRRTALHVAAAAGHTGVCEVLLAEPSFTKEEACGLNGRSALHMAAECGHAQVAVALLRSREFGAEAARDAFGCGALHSAAANGHEAVCETLLSLGCGAADRDADGWTPLHSAAAAGQLAAAAAIIAHQRFTDVGARTTTGRTALHIAADCGHAEVCQLLLDSVRLSEVDIRMLDGNCQPCWRSAVQEGMRETSRLILKHPRVVAFRLGPKEVDGHPGSSPTMDEDISAYSSAVACFRAYMRGVPVRMLWEEAMEDANKYWDYKLAFREERSDLERIFEDAEEALEVTCEGFKLLTPAVLTRGLARAVARLERADRLKSAMDRCTSDAVREALRLKKTVHLPYGTFGRRTLKACEKQACGDAIDVLRARGMLRDCEGLSLFTA